MQDENATECDLTIFQHEKINILSSPFEYVASWCVHLVYLLACEQISTGNTDNLTETTKDIYLETFAYLNCDLSYRRLSTANKTTVSQSVDMFHSHKQIGAYVA